MKIQTTRGRLLASTMICGVLTLGVGGHAFAADEAANKDSGNEVTEVVVTGSRLQRKDFTAISPVTTVGSEQLEMTGTVAVEQLVNELPQIVPGNTVTSNNSGGEDFATVDLRGLGAQRTLVVVNGERVPGSSTTGVVDLNTIPAGLIDRIEVLTGGASAVYGSDAMSGVVNFILKQNYEGAEVSALVGGNFHGQGKEFNLEGILGGNFANGRGNMTMYASYFQRNPVLQSEFDWSKTSAEIAYNTTTPSAGHYVYNTWVVDSAKKWEALNLANGATISGSGVESQKIGPFLSGGSGTPPWGWITNNGANPFSNLAALLPGQFAAANTDCLTSTPGVPVNTGNLSFNDAGALTPRFTSKACAVPDRAAGSSRYNFAPTNDIIIPAKRYAISTFAHYDITDNITVKTQLSFIDSQSGVQLAATPATGLNVRLTPGANGMAHYIQVNHPDLWTALQSRTVNPNADFTMDWRSLQLGPRIGEFDNQSLSLLATVDGKINDNWNWSVTASYGQTRFAETLRNNLNRTAITQGLGACKDAAGNQDPGALPGCVTTDIFGPNKLSAAAVTFLRVDTHQLNIYQEQRVAGFIRGDILQLPAGGLSTVFGFEYREDHASLDVDDAQRTGNIYGFNAIQNQKGSVTVKEAYMEVGVPLIKDAPFAQYLGLEGGYRWSDYDTIGSTETYKIGGEWSPTSWLKFRAVYNKAVRAPSVFELFQNGDQGFPAFTDPCNDKALRTATILAICQAQAPGANFTGYQQNNSQVQAFAFGNPNLQPETGKTQTYGVVFQPDFLPLGRLKASVDYYDIKIENAVASIGAQTIANRCYGQSSPTNSNCLLIQRDNVTGQVVGINTSIANISELDTKGIDVQVDYKVDLGDIFSGAPGRLSVNELYSKLESFKQDGFELKGTTQAAIGTAYPKYKSVLTVNYGVADWLFQVRWSYVPEMEGGDFPNSEFACGSANQFKCRFSTPKSPAASYVDLSTRWNVTDNFQLTGTIGNLFDKDPPQTEEGVLNGQGNTDPQTYRVLGRTFTLAAKVRF